MLFVCVCVRMCVYSSVLPAFRHSSCPLPLWWFCVFTFSLSLHSVFFNVFSCESSTPFSPFHCISKYAGFGSWGCFAVCSSSDLMRVSIKTMLTFASARRSTPARFPRSATPVWSGCWRGWQTCASFLSTSLTPSCIRTASLPLLRWSWTSWRTSIKSPSPPFQSGD